MVYAQTVGTVAYCHPQLQRKTFCFLDMQTPRSQNIAELGLALFSSCANINRLEIIDLTSHWPPWWNRLLLFGACCNARVTSYPMYISNLDLYVGGEEVGW